MKTTDIMVGDWVDYVGKGGQIYRDRIAGIIDGCFTVEKEMIHRCPTDLRPIPLTAEILEKNFKSGSKSDDPFAPDYIIPGVHNSFGLELRKEVLYITDHALMPIRYVHELQHALRLCGLHESADNFKI